MRVRWSPEARRDAVRLSAFLRKRHPPAVHQFWTRIVSVADALSANPRIGRAADDDEAERQIVVRFGGAGYVIRYRVDEDDVVIARVWHAREHRE
ncbi:type II toxin-antitoxin system RelE/ParE family toxin [Anaeromyxobacter oryzisoli]|uniref:type II toxin-antitoxin system RelE/ParE family toxin n=1 Tax=Anaeromyxobacter oryzisoli TaxID=2925408 RepID=UPI001F5AA91C|nr:type II toxin-antitoxin system RelE/ParE family toxin [Anaeromyxobacter sp. SG63]